MEQEEIYLLVTRYLARQTSSEENEWLAVWVALSPANEQTFEQLKVLWEGSKTSPAPLETAAALHRVKARLVQPAGPAPVPVRRPVKARAYQLVLPAVAVLASVGAAVFHWYPQPTEPVAYRVQRTAAGQKLTLQLADHSVVTLAPQSQLRYPRQFGGPHRDVYLEGEAFFEVSKDARRPFRVHSGSWVTQVLGTKFNVSAFRRAAHTSVSLVEGRVEVLDAHNKYLLTPGQQLLAEPATGRVYRRVFNQAKVVAWKSNKLIFQNEKLADVAGEIERLYNVKLVFADSATAETRLWATFNNEPLTAVLEALQLAGPVACRREGRVIYISERPAAARNE
ncbi:FecR domain-containing protein [Hymenobacter sp. BT186]|uniref:FecR domain-containing protein n=1 Tax=Hymenobacter telluris TaxID=2816474 RepID=A0A939EZ83_9BACT|nr:FecR domain-containing protein [Hymenobacter telluris]MBO0360225.1 FecR domain-containing protein [Hymenobacter telluris]MBW3376252.1 FecR domain-containing protein [Hymenobacter norwichensis]